MNYAGFSSKESPTMPNTGKMNSEKSCKFVILWHALPSMASPVNELEGTGESSELRVQSSGLDRDRFPSFTPLQSHAPFSAPRTSHFDLMFQDSEHLITFELPKIPIPGERVSLCRLQDHRLHYLEYEGALDPGPNAENRGFVTRWTAGSYHIYRWTRQKLIVELTSPKLSARIVLLPGNEADGVIETRSTHWPGVISWELRVPRWDVK